MANEKNQLTTEKPSERKDFVPMASSAIGNTGTRPGDGKDTGNTLLQQAKSTAGEAYDTVAEKATSTLEEHKAGITGGLSSVADSMRKAGDSLASTSDQNYMTQYSAQYARTAAEKMEQLAGYFENNDLKAMARDAESYARRNPAIFLGGAFVLGVLAARFFKSSPVPQISVGQTSTPLDHQLEADFEKSRSSETGPTGF